MTLTYTLLLRCQVAKLQEDYVSNTTWIISSFIQKHNIWSLLIPRLNSQVHDLG